MHGDTADSPLVGALPERAARVPLDRRNTAPPTRARFEYQDELAALIVLKSLTGGGLEGVLVERATDLALLPVEGDVELISIKHRELSQQGNPTWSLTELTAAVLADLHRYWATMDRTCRVVFSTNAGFSGNAYKLAKACEQHPAAKEDFPDAAVKELRKRAGASKSEAEAFLAALTLDGGHPSRDHISASGIMAARDLLKAYRPGPITVAETVYEELCELIRDRSIERPPKGGPGSYLAATITETRRNRAALAENRQYLPADGLLDFLLRVHDRAALAAGPDPGGIRWVADTAFVGRTDALDAIDRLLQPGSSSACAPLVLHGIPGCGKSALAMHYAATRTEHLRAIRINGENRAHVATELELLRHNRTPPAGPSTLLAAAPLPGPVAPALPPNTALLIIIDGVLDPAALSGLIPASSLCRVIITANSRGANPGWNTLELGPWSRDESRQYLQHALPNSSADDADALAAALHDHPLGITQAAAYCASTARTVTNFLDRFKAHPSHMLSREPAPGHPNLITTTTDLLLAEAHRRAPAALDLARALALHAATPVQEESLHVELQNPALLALPTPARAAPNRRRAFWKRRSDEPTPLDFDAMLIPGAEAVIFGLQETNAMSDAVDTLVRLALVRRDGTGLSMHPLVALVIREATPDLRIALALAYSWTLDGAEHFEHGNLPHFHERVSHLHALTSTAIRLGLEGPVVRMSCYWLSLHLMRLPTRNYTAQETSRYRSLYDVAARGYVLAIEHIQSPGGLHFFTPMAGAYAHVMMSLGHIRTSFDIYQELVRTGVQHGQSGSIASALMNMAILAEDHPAEHLRPEIDAAWDLVDGLDDDPVRAAVLYAKAIRHRYEGETREAIAACDQAIAITGALGPRFEQLLAVMLNERAEAARDAGEGFTSTRINTQRLEAAIARGELLPDRQVIHELCSAGGGALDHGDMVGAKIMLKHARELAGQGFQDDAAVQASLHSFAGLYHVARGQWSLAQEALNQAIAIQARPECPPLGGLASDHFNLSVVQTMLNDTDQAVQSAERALETDRARFAERHPQVVKDFTNLAEITLRARANDDLNDLVAVYETATGHRNSAMAPGFFPDGRHWWNGVAIGKSIEPLTDREAIGLACTVLTDLGREVIDVELLGPEPRLTVLNPLGLVTVRRDGEDWYIIEILQILFYYRDVFNDLTDLDLGLEAD
ncbi:tetratricopeptide repeat protein [Glycomyces sp. NPDC047369]